MLSCLNLLECQAKFQSNLLANSEFPGLSDASLASIGLTGFDLCLLCCLLLFLNLS
jgi:hypothetical protein